MITFAGDCDLDVAKPLRALDWKVVRTQFAAKDRVQTQTFLGVVRKAWDSTSSCRGLHLTQSDYTAKILEDAVKNRLWFDSCLHRCWTVRHTA